MIKLVNNENLEKVLNKVLFANYFIYQFFLVFSESVIATNVPMLHLFTVNIIRISFVIVIIINVFKLLCGKYSVKEIVGCTLIGLFFLYVYFKFKDGMLLLNLLYVCAFKDIDLKILLKLYFISTISAVLIVGLFGNITGLTNSIDTYRLGALRIRHSMGFNSRPTAPYFLLSATIAIMIIIKDNLIKWSLSLYILNLLYFILTLSRAPFLYLNIFFLLYYMIIKNNNVFNILLSIISKLSYVVLPIFSYVISLYYDSDNKFFYFLNKVLTGRLSLTHNALSSYRVGLFGPMAVEQVSNIGRAYVDSSFVHYMLYKGIIVFIVLIVINLIYIHILSKTKNYLLVLAMLIVAFMSTFDVGFMALQYSPFIIPFMYLLNKCKD